MHQKPETGPGHPYPIGASVTQDGINFSLFSKNEKEAPAAEGYSLKEAERKRQCIRSTSSPKDQVRSNSWVPHHCSSGNNQSRRHPTKLQRQS